MKCKICGKETENDFCDECFTKAMGELEKKTKKSSKINKIVLTCGFLAIIFCSTILITSGSTIQLFDSDIISEKIAPKSETMLIDNPEPEKPVIEPKHEKPVIEPEYIPDEDYNPPVIEPEYIPEDDYNPDVKPESEIETIYIDYEEWIKQFEPEETYEAEEIYEPTDIEICQEVIKDYYNNHVIGENTYDSYDMTCDVWNILQAKGIKSQIVVGNLEFNSENKQYKFKDTNYAWIIAYPDNNHKIALDCCTGKTSNDQKYFNGFWFDDPLKLKNYFNLYNEVTDAEYEYKVAKEYYKDLEEGYYKCDSTIQEYLLTGLHEAETEMIYRQLIYEKKINQFKEAGKDTKPYM